MTWVYVVIIGNCVDFSSLSILVVEESDVLLGAGLQDQVITCSHSNK